MTETEKNNKKVLEEQTRAVCMELRRVLSTIKCCRGALVDVGTTAPRDDAPAAYANQKALCIMCRYDERAAALERELVESGNIAIREHNYFFRDRLLYIRFFAH